MDWDTTYLLKLSQMRMPFGKYEGVLLVNLPERYLIWCLEKKIAIGSLGDMLQAIYEIKLNGLEHLIENINKLDNAR